VSEKRFVPLTVKINLLILASLIIGIGAISYFFARSIYNTIDTSTEENLSQQSEILFTSIENMMITGNAPIAVNFFKDIKTSNPDYTIRLYRRDGDEAFTDNSTIREVNDNIDTATFEEREGAASATVEPIEDNFAVATGMPPQPVFFQMQEENELFFIIYKPLINLPKCTRCHGSDHTVRGVIDIESNITDAQKQQQYALLISGSLFLGMVVILTVLLSQFLKAAVISPVKKIGTVCTNVTNGDFDERVDIGNNDEIGTLGTTVNTMVEGLQERFELSKYVSSSTIASLRGKEKGRKIPVTLFFSDIRGFTSYSENKDPETVVTYLNKILNMQTEILINNNGDIDKYVGDEIVAMFSGDNGHLEACRAALEIQKELTQSSEDEYGGLTVGIGINTGEVIMGMIGSERRADFTVIGDEVNSASRLCDAAKPFQILISDITYKKAQRKIQAEGPFKLRVKGKKTYLRVYILHDTIDNDEESSA
jgi:adenylate cyclase